MSDYEIRAVTKLNLDSVSDKDVIDEIESLVAHRKLGEYITSLLRFASTHREDLAELGFDNSRRGDDNTRRRQMDGLKKQTDDLKEKIDGVYEIALALRTAYETGKVVGLEKQAENLIATQLVLQVQLNKLRRLLGDGYEYSFRGMPGDISKAEIDKAARTGAEIAIQHYGETLTQMATMFDDMMSQARVPMMPDAFATYQSNLKVANSVPENVETPVSEKIVETKPNPSDTDGEGDNKSDKKFESTQEVVFNGDLGALSDFFGI